MKTIFTFFITILLFLHIANAQIINIPDANFKAKLLTPCAYVGTGTVYSKVDTNNDGEIQVSEALAVKLLNVGSRQIASLTGIEYFINLYDLDCNTNQLTSLNVQNLTKLEVLDCYNNQIAGLNVQGLDSLEYLYCGNNRIPSLNVQGLTKLKWLQCYENQIPSLNVQGLPNLTLLQCHNNQIPSLNVQGSPNLKTLSCGNNRLTTLNLQGMTKIDYLHCSDNLLTTLDVQDLSALHSLVCGNTFLTSLFIKNGSNETTLLHFTGSPSLAYICCDDAQLTNVAVLVGQYGYNCIINSYCSFTPGGLFYTIQGEDRLDTNMNGCDANDTPFPYMKYNITNGTNTGNIIANASGEYSIAVGAGTHTLTPNIEIPTYFNISPPSRQVSFPAATSPLTQNFCIVPNGTHHDVEVVLIPITVARPGFDAKYKIVYKNKGTVAESDSILFRFNDAKTDFLTASLAPQSQRKDTLAWYFSNLQPFETRTIDLTLNINSPMETPAVNAGEIFNLKAAVFPAINDETPGNNRSNMRQIVVGSFDPNDKTCIEGDKITPDMVGDYLHYIIRFENTGTYSAENIVVKDIIDTTKFDLKSLQITHTSHSCVTRTVNKNQVEFIFENINLPFTEPDKHGFVAFKIKTKPNLVLGNIIRNEAEIFFDYNFPIATNVAVTQIATLVDTEQTTDDMPAFALQPNPVSDILTFKTAANIEKTEVYDALGRIVSASGVQNQSVSVVHLPKGIYFIKAYSQNGFAIRKFVKE